MSIDLKYEHIFNDHMEMARKRLIERNKEEPSQKEIRAEYRKMMEYFYD